MVSPNAESKEHEDDSIMNRGVAFCSDVVKEAGPMDDDTKKLAPDVCDRRSMNTSDLDHDRKCFTNASNSSNSSNSGVDSYNADCSGGSDDQSSDDTSGKTKIKGAIMMNIASVRHKSNSGKNSDSASSSCSSGGRNCEATSNLSSKKHDCKSFWKETTEQVVNTLPLLQSSSNYPVTYPKTSVALSSISPVDPRIDVSIVNSFPSSALLLPLQETARAALFQCNASAATESVINNVKPASVLSAESYHHLLEVTKYLLWFCFLLWDISLFPLYISWFDSASHH
jgi:hypothetical protein